MKQKQVLDFCEAFYASHYIPIAFFSADGILLGSELPSLMSPDKNNFSFTSPISESFCLPNGALRIASFLRLIQETSIGGSAFLGDGVETLKAKNLYWVVMEIKMIHFFVMDL